jgi:hypothetical protein
MLVIIAILHQELRNTTHHCCKLPRAGSINMRGKRHHHGADEFDRDARRFVKGRPADFEQGPYVILRKIRPLMGILKIEIQLHSGKIDRPAPGAGLDGVAKTVRRSCMVVDYTSIVLRVASFNKIELYIIWLH